MGVIPKILQGDPVVANTETGKRYRQMANEGKELELFGEIIAQVNKVVPVNQDLHNPEINKTVWKEIIWQNENYHCLQKESWKY